ncbi:ABC-2 transporter permease [Bacillus sp. APMAM]|nr:ABC-2 transporter permease [Bacillus sp. APMAM]RTZ55328.1 ABC-2 transporter permease [Bacillus sp. SAJ1]
MLFHLVKKDLLLTKKYWLFMIIFAFVAPIIISAKLGLSNDGFISLLITVLFTEYVLFNSVSMLEEKSKGSVLLCTTPYKRDGVIKAKYLLILIIFLGCIILYALSTFIGISPTLQTLSIEQMGVIMLLVSLFFGILIPVQVKFGYEKTKYIGFFIVFLTPFVLPHLMKWMEGANIRIDVPLLLSKPIFAWLPFIASIIIGFVSMLVSVKIYTNKDL